MTIRSTCGTDWYRAGERAMLLASIEEWAAPGTLPACLYSTGYTGRPEFVTRSTVFDYAASQVLPRTHSVLSMDAGGTATFGNDTAIAAVQAAAAWSATKGRPGPFLIAGTSMGFMDTMAWARTHQDQVRAVVGFFPGVNLTVGWQQNRAGSTADVNLAYGGLYDPAVHGPTHDPTQYAAQLDFPILLFAADDDAVVLPAEVDAFAAAVGSNCQVVHLGNSGGHAKASMDAACARPELGAFLQAHLTA